MMDFIWLGENYDEVSILSTCSKKSSRIVINEQKRILIPCWQLIG
jgi:hypothetical protein